MNLKNVNWMKIAGTATTVIGVGLTFANDWIAEKNLDSKISKKVEEAVSKLNLSMNSNEDKES